jgi:hypothetical protein
MGTAEIGQEQPFRMAFVKVRLRIRKQPFGQRSANGRF